MTQQFRRINGIKKIWSLNINYIIKTINILVCFCLTENNINPIFGFKK